MSRAFFFFFHCGVLLPSRVAARHNAPRRTAYASSRRPASRPRAQILARVRKCPRRRCVARVSHAIRGASAPQQPSGRSPGRPHPPVSAGAVSQSCTSCVSFSVQALRVTSIRSAAERTSVGLGDPPRCGPQAWNRRTSHRAQMTYSLYLSAHRHNPRLLGIKGGVAHTMSIPIRQGVASSVRSCHASSCTIRAAAVLFASGTYRLTNLAPSQLLSPALPLCSSGCAQRRARRFSRCTLLLAAAAVAACCMPHSVTAVGLPASRVDSQATLEYCDGQGRVARLGFDVACPVYAIPSEHNNETRPATSCLEIKEIFPAAPSAPYYLKFCLCARREDMVRDGTCRVRIQALGRRWRW